jgi:hypothetical protein
MPKRQNSYFVMHRYEPVQRYVARMPIGNDQLADRPFHAAAHQWMRGQRQYGRLNRLRRLYRGIRILVTQKLKRTLDMLERAGRIGYRRHSLGRGVDPSVVSRVIQACTSSAR